uniref:Fucosyltransferase n=1 Tax=Phallusia mammillata TaxID=59560 RepID=A0A6F9DCL2_9ASCI|nr:alpha-(1,3)-fucosyltransferase 6-like [Phallusia mammillata]
MTSSTTQKLGVVTGILCLVGLGFMLMWTDNTVVSISQKHYWSIVKNGTLVNALLHQISASNNIDNNEAKNKNDSAKTEDKKNTTVSEATNFTSTTKITTTTTTTTTTTSITKQPVTTPVVAKKPGIILMWTHPWNVDSEPPSDGKVFGNCTITYDRSKHAEALAVVFHYTFVPEPYPYPRDPNQFFVWWSWENPWVVRWMEHNDLRRHDNSFFNWTMTYRRDSDVYAPYYLLRNVYNNLPKGKKVVDDLIAAKKGLAVWTVSSCKDKKGSISRMNYVNEMLKTMPNIDRFGKCFGDKWPHAKMADFVRTRKFYLSFENAVHCRDYITEKLTRNGYQYGAVPVVRGPKKEDYLVMAPPHSFIHTEDFASPAELTKYLMYLDKNDTAYREYFKWREDPSKTWDDQRMEVERRHPNIKTLPDKTYWFGKLCEQVQNRAPPKVIPSLRKVFFDDTEECQDEN